MVEFNGMSSQSQVSHCRVLPLGEFTVMIPEPHATLHGVRIPSAILKVVIRHCFLNAVWALTSGGFRIVPDALVIITIVIKPIPRRTIARCGMMRQRFRCVS